MGQKAPDRRGDGDSSPGDLGDGPCRPVGGGADEPTLADTLSASVERGIDLAETGAETVWLAGTVRADSSSHCPNLGETVDANVVTSPAGDAIDAGAPTVGARQAEPRQPRVMPKIPDYEIFHELGRGGMGVVYKARQTGLQRLCALKMILGGAHATSEAATRFLTEAAAIAKLQHPNIVQIYHIGEADGLPFFELEFVPGGSLEKSLDGTPWSPKKAADMAEKLALAMGEAHRQGIVHRDLKPGNVLLTRDGSPKITDFGLAKAMDSETGVTRTESILGSPSYMAPEQAEGRTKEASPETDVYALGAILYELITGRPPFRGATLLETLEHVKHAEPVPPSRLVPNVPRDLETICLKCLSKEPEKRYRTADELAGELRSFLDDKPIKARPISRPARAVRWCRRNPRDAALVGLLTLLPFILAFGASFAAYRISRERDRAEEQRKIADQQKQIAERNEGIAKANAEEARKAQAEATKQANLALNTIYDVVTKAEENLRPRAEMGALRKELLELAMKNLDQIARDATNSKLADRTMGVALQRMGNFYEQMGNTEKGIETYRRSLEIFRRLMQDQPDEDWNSFNLAVSYDHLGETGREVEPEPGKLFDLYGRAQALRKGLVEHVRSPNPTPFQRKYAMAVSSIKLAALAMEVGDPKLALAKAIEALDVSVSLGRELPPESVKDRGPKELQQRLVLASANLFLGRANHRLGNESEARTRFQQAADQLQSIIESDPTNAYVQQELGRVYDAIGEMEQEQGHIPQCIEKYEAARSIFQDLVNKDQSNPEYRWYLANTQYHLGPVLHQQGDPAAADLLQQCLETRRFLEKNDPKNIQRTIELMLALARTGDIPGADALAEKVVAYAPRHPGKLFSAACAEALCVATGAAGKDEPQGSEFEERARDRHARRAVEILKMAAEHGYRDARALETNLDLDPIRDRDDFRALMQTLATAK
jgi:serine/threonine-protein kinase